jgi:hypothetical protein
MAMSSFTANPSHNMPWKESKLVYKEYEPEVRISVWYKDVISIVRFLISHEPFTDNLTYAPIREYNSSGKRIYTQAYTANGWWDLQKQFPEGATVIPIQWMSDKTHLTQHRGDRTLHACYVSIMNLSRELRRSKIRPATLPLALLPILDKDISQREPDLKRRIFHDALSLIFKRNAPLISLLSIS